MRPTVRAVSSALVGAIIFGGSASCSSRSLFLAQPEPSEGIAAEAAGRGRLLTASACAGCHATGLTGQSPMQAATPFREIVHRYPLDQLEAAFAEGRVTTHPAMPDYTFRASEIDDLIAYLETLRAER